VTSSALQSRKWQVDCRQLASGIAARHPTIYLHAKEQLNRRCSQQTQHHPDHRLH